MASMLVSAERLSQVFDSDPRSDSVIAESFHVSKQSISAWKKGDRSPKKSKLKEIADFYGKDVPGSLATMFRILKSPSPRRRTSRSGRLCL